MALNVITAKFCSGATQTWASDAWQYDYGQVLQFDGLDLPEAYQVHFSNEPMTGETITQIGNADGVSVPDQFFQSGEPIFAWVYLHEGEDDGETVYMVTIPVKKRPQPSDEVPTPEEQSAIDQAIAALNIAVEKADEAITHYPQIIDGTWHVWDVTAEEYVDTGVEAQGPHGDPGTPGDDGFSPTVTVTEITGGHRVTITDESGEHTFDVMDGQGGGGTITVDPALSPTSENPVQNKVIDAALADVMEDLSQLQTDVDGKVDDVQINGTSVVTDGVASIPTAGYGENEKGVVYYNNAYGVSVSANGMLRTYCAVESTIKNADQLYRPIVPTYQHIATFYGLTKAAGVDMASSSNAVGTYTDEAKIAIQKMLGIYEPPWELLNDITLDAEGGIDLTVDSNGTSYNLLSVYIYIFYAENLSSVTDGYGRYRFYDSDGKYINTETGKYTTSTSQKYKHIFIDRRNNLTFGNYVLQQTKGGQSGWVIKSGDAMRNNGGVVLDLGNITRIAMPGSDVEPAGTQILVFGQRAY